MNGTIRSIAAALRRACGWLVLSRAYLDRLSDAEIERRAFWPWRSPLRDLPR